MDLVGRLGRAFTRGADIMSTERGAAPPATSGIRWRVLGLICLLSMVTYLDRVNISIAAKSMIDHYGLTQVGMGQVFSAFILAYGLFQVPGGWLGDRYGPRLVIALAVLWWSAFTALTAVVADIVPQTLLPPVWSLVLARFAFGAGEAAAWPCFNRAIANWMSVGERAFATSVPLAGGGVGAAVAPPLIAWVLVYYGWRESFYVSGAIGAVAAVAWYVVVRDRPEDHPAVSPTELAHIRSGATDEAAASYRSGTPWRAIFANRNVYLLFASAMTCGYMVYIYMTWFVTYLVNERGLSLMQGSLYTTGPFIAMALLSPLGGVLSDVLVRRRGRRTGRRAVSMAGMLVSAASMILGTWVADIHFAIVWLSLGAGAIYFALSAHWATTIDISKEHAGTVSGIMNWGGNMGGMISPILTPILAETLGWTPALRLAAAIIFAGALLWMFVDPERRVVPGLIEQTPTPSIPRPGTASDDARV